MKRTWITAAAASAVLMIAAGKYKNDLMQYLYARKAAKHPGNAPEYGLSAVQKEEDSILKGKTIAWLGSSVTFGAASGGICGTG